MSNEVTRQDKGTGQGQPVLLPGHTTIGILGGGQLGRMMTLAGTAMGYRFVTLDPTPDSPCGQIAKQIEAGYDDVQAKQENSRGNAM